MRPLKLILSGWGPYKDTETIDFTRFAQNGLFLICGPTGGGKTTIFDGITYALFGEVSGSIREKDSLRSDFAHGGTPTYVSLEFCHQEKHYRVIRNPKYERPKLRGEGTTAEAEGGELYCEETLLATGGSGVTAQIETLLNVDYQQFKQLSLIAQGEFQRLLTANSKERTQIFRTIFKTSLYASIGNLLAASVKSCQAQLDELKLLVDETLSRCAVETEAWAEQYQKKNRNYQKMTEMLKEQQTLLKQEIKDLEVRAAQAQAVYTEQVRQAEQIRQKNREWLQYREDQRKLRELEQKREHLEAEYREAGKAWERLPEQKEALEQCRQTIRELNAAREQLLVYERQKVQLKKRQDRYLVLDQDAKWKKAEFERHDDQNRKAAAGLLAQSLQDGIPCPVCGSVHHPSPAKVAGGLLDETELQALKQAYEAAWEQAMEAQKEAAALAGSLQQMELALTVTDLQQLEEQLKQKQRENGQLTEEIQRTEQKFQSLQLQLERVKTAYEEKLEGLKVPEIQEEQPMEPLEAAILESDQRRKEIERRKAQVSTRQEQNGGNLTILKERLKKRKKVEQAYSAVRELERAAGGYNQKNLVLEQYVLSVYFDEILKAANLRLRVMTNDRYELYRLPMSRDRRMKEGMELEVLDQYTGKRRSAKSLSGGETFQAALALALGTSDVVQAYAGGIQVETLFVDEGFGALDEDALHQAVSILTSLSGQNRLIGIISHVEELKEQIECQIQVERTNTGSRIRQ